MTCPYTVLYVEDDAGDAARVQSYFQTTSPDFTVEVVTTGQACLDRLRRSHVDLVLLDYRLPDMDGLELVRRLSDDIAAQTIILVTGAGNDELVLKAARLGVTHYLRKDPGFEAKLPELCRTILTTKNARPTSSPRGLRILCLTDNAADIAGLRAACAEAAPHLQLDCLSTVAEAGARLHQAPAYDLLLLDLEPPLQDGLRVVRDLLDKHLRPPPFLVLTGLADESLAIEAQALGAIDYIGKSPQYLKVLPYRLDRAFALSEASASQRQLQAELELRRRSERDLHITVDSIGDAVIATNAAGQLTRLNRMAEKLTGWPASEALGKPLSEVLTLVHAETRAVLADPFRVVLQQHQTTTLNRHALLLARNGKEYRIADSASPITDEFGAVCGMVLVFHDVTAQLALELRLRQAERQDVVGQLAGGIAHDFNNMLAVILGAADLIETRTSTDIVVCSQLRMLNDAANRAKDLTSKLLGFARRGKMRLESVDLHHEVQTVLAILTRTLDPRITLIADQAADRPWLAGDPGQVQSLLLNLCVNARDAMPAGGTLTLATADLPATSPELVRAGLPAIPHVALTISDTGCGIPTWVMARLYEPFITTKERGKGTGLGLAAVYGAVIEHHGLITVDNRPGTGASFRILLPTCPPPAPPLVAPPAKPQGLHGLVVLVADDEELMREMLTGLLETAGATVVTAVDGQEAIELFTAEPDRYALVILDQIMPRCTGREAFKAMHALRPQTRILLMSGYVGDHVLEDQGLDGLAGFLAKPFTRAQLLQAALAATPA